MIYNRVTAKDLGILGNFKSADAPVSYPFLWNAWLQDRTQWTGIVPNGLATHAFARNAGQVLGVFGELQPRLIIPATPATPAQIDFTTHSVDFPGLASLEKALSTLTPPPWPKDVFGFDPGRAARGRELFAANCSGCHGVEASTAVKGAWKTPIVDVQTDPKTSINADRTASSGVLEGAGTPDSLFASRLGPVAAAKDILALSVVGVMVADLLTELQEFPFPEPGVLGGLLMDYKRLSSGTPTALSISADPSLAKTLLLQFAGKIFAKPQAGNAYEARVLNGIWATAPYLHNGSVPNLWELLQPPKQRKPAFMVGSRVFDPRLVGYSTDESPSKNGQFVADPKNGNGNGGHEFGTDLPEEDRWSLIEYLKSI